MPNDNNFLNILTMLEAVLEKLPATIGKKMKEEITILKELVMEQRPPRFMVVGRRGAGKSSLLNAIFGEKVAAVGSVTSTTGESMWYTWKTSRGQIELLDTRGLGDNTKPESANFKDAIDDINVAVNTVFPDALLFLCKAKEVDSRIADDLLNVNTIINHIKSKHAYAPPVVGIVTQVDELDPLSDSEPPFQKKSKNIAESVQTLEAAFKSKEIDLMQIIPTSSYAEYDETGKQIFTKFWNIDKLVEYIIDHIPREAQIQFARMSAIKSAQEKSCRVLIHSTATICAGIAAIPIPVADIIPITSAQVGLIISIGYVSGRSLTLGNARDFMAAAGLNVGGAFALREAARALVKFVFPGGGLVISAGVAYAGTWAIGEAAIAYFVQGKNIDQVKVLIKEVFDKKNTEKSE